MHSESTALGTGSLCFVGYMAGAKPGHTTSQGFVLSDLMRGRGWRVMRFSEWHNRFLRLADVVSQLSVRSYPGGTVAVLEVYGGRNFMLVDAASAAAQWKGLPIVMVLHGGSLPDLFRARPAWTRRVLARASRLVAPSRYLARAARDIHNLDADVIPNVVPVERYAFQLRENLRPRLFWMRGFHGDYNPGMAIRVLERVRREYPEASLIMAGRHNAVSEEMQRLAAAKGLSAAVEFPGFIDQAGKDRAAAESDVFINTNRIDNMPVAVVEACAYGLPVVATAVGGIPDLLTEAETGLLVPPDDDAAMAAAIGRLLSVPGLAGRLSRAGREMAMQSARELVVPRWERLFQAVAAGEREQP